MEPGDELEIEIKMMDNGYTMSYYVGSTAYDLVFTCYPDMISKILELVRPKGAKDED